eukprot:CAMPEP_0181120938 /NCGR_PEP_ID=MMETSP1071-20121207/24448_1 /TAXON_ID=35127 /ORGANISM="Thalassiosira sp., Strain NH16" /LENGTH=299 /DNA_ID=CAMNT_0023205677 /DNA_START=87 /DNA_END=982 /DNA_ORIENTATION=-
MNGGRRVSSAARARRMNGSIHLSMPSAAAADSIVRSLSAGSIPALRGRKPADIIGGGEGGNTNAAARVTASSSSFELVRSNIDGEGDSREDRPPPRRSNRLDLDDCDDGDNDDMGWLEDEIADSKPCVAPKSVIDIDLAALGYDQLSASDNRPKNNGNISSNSGNRSNDEKKRSILDRRRRKRALFTRSAADAPLPKPPSSSSLKSCMSSSGTGMNYRGSGSSLQSHTRTNNEGRHNEEWSSVALCHPRKSVQFSRVRVREYETVRSARNNDDLTSSCPAVGLGWRYNPKETVSSLTTT